MWAVTCMGAVKCANCIVDDSTRGLTGYSMALISVSSAALSLV